jgi:hypothetical protein
MDHTGISGEDINITGLSASGSVYLENNTFTRTSAVSGDLVVINYTFTSADSLVIDKCLGYGLYRCDGFLANYSAQSVTGAIRVQNSIIRTMAQSGCIGIQFQVACTNVPLYVYNNTFYAIGGSGAVGLTDTRALFKNNAFAGSAIDVALAGTSSNTDFTYNAFQAQGSPFGSNNIFAIVTATEFVDAANSDFHLNTGAQCKNAGTTIGAVVDDYVYVSRPQGASYDIGAYEFVESSVVTLAPNSLAMTGYGI